MQVENSLLSGEFANQVRATYVPARERGQSLVWQFRSPMIEAKPSPDEVPLLLLFCYGDCSC